MRISLLFFIYKQRYIIEEVCRNFFLIIHTLINGSLRLAAFLLSCARTALCSSVGNCPNLMCNYLSLIILVDLSVIFRRFSDGWNVHSTSFHKQFWILLWWLFPFLPIHLPSAVLSVMLCLLLNFWFHQYHIRCVLVCFLF